MNFLGHIYFSNNNLPLMTANIYGDFVRGRDLSEYPEIIQQGIILHREIDNYIDTHPKVLTLMRSLYAELPKVAGIAVDLYFDHLLAKNWSKFHTQPLREYLNNYYASLEEFDYDYPLEFLIMLGRMRTGDWLWHYQSEFGLNKACNGVSNRIAFKNVLNQGVEVFKKNEDRITEAFFAFMIEAQDHFNIKKL